MHSGEPVADHAIGTARIVDTLNVDPPTHVAALLFPFGELLDNADTVLAARFGDEVAGLVADVRKLLRLRVGGRVGRHAGKDGARESLKDVPADGMRDGAKDARAAAQRREQVEALRKMLLAFAQDIRVVLIRLASRLQTLRYHAATKTEPAPDIAQETLDIYAPLANRLGIWQLKWELEDLAFRFLEPVTYKEIAKLLDSKRIVREAFVENAIERLSNELASAGIKADVSGRPKHIYSIWKKMRGKDLAFSELYDVRAFRVIVDSVKDCYAVLGLVHHIWQPVPKEFDDYISRPKPNGYKSLHTVVIAEDGQAFEVQIRTHEMHRFAEYGVAAHWRYKEAGTKGYGGTVTAADKYDERIAWLRQLLAWKDDVTDGAAGADVGDAPVGGAWDRLKHATLDDHIYVLTPEARVVALPHGATPLDFAYHLHTELGHRCRGARVNGAMVPLNTPLENGQTVEIVAIKQGGPSRDWLNPQLGYLQSARARQKVRVWFNAIDTGEHIAAGRALVEKTLQREGKTAVNLEELATKLGFKTPDDLFNVVGKEEFSLRAVEQAVRDHGVAPAPEAEPEITTKRSSQSSVAQGASSGVLVVGVGALMTQLARCCRPAPPDPIIGFVTRGKGVSIHRVECASFARLAQRSPERVLHTAWSDDVMRGKGHSVYPVDLVIEATDRQGLLRDISEVFAREKTNVIGVKTSSQRNAAFMQFTVEVSSAAQLQRATTLLGEIPGVMRASRK
ncbi:bifunctional (p)ppGpp synthetase/guanosine-3',5'-bis(diphosphate) 3'-pyrophosphohydrolase [Pararobbsia silviterrae]|uniref:GTP pyrophosphokinase n=2 Tax=Pararobbsia silviterrae TaxID=1792498 RepID=A0A494XBU8_9BURK|nr:bifunctional (p)ppGpp synthetase/guanosine-3',5'-bis(diphosphate) 3'-pyrophosphohydrolase [Pararobbsia silviterrae]